jgi:predicted Fe-Mo cluster-binding NifX family protein
MKVAVCASANTKEAKVSERFARSSYFMIYDKDTMDTTFIENNAKNEASGAGGKATKLLSDLGVDVVLVPQLGPKAFDAIEAFEMKAYEYKKGITAHKALYDFFAQDLKEVDTAKGIKKH